MTCLSDKRRVQLPLGGTPKAPWRLKIHAANFSQSEVALSAALEAAYARVTISLTAHPNAFCLHEQAAYPNQGTGTASTYGASSTNSNQQQQGSNASGSQGEIGHWCELLRASDHPCMRNSIVRRFQGACLPTCCGRGAGMARSHQLNGVGP